MDVSAADQLVELARICSTATAEDSLFETALPILRSVCGADSVLVVRRKADAYDTAAAAGYALDPTGVGEQLPTAVRGALTWATVPPAWTASGVTTVALRRLPGDGQAIVLTWATAPSPDARHVDTALDLIDGGLARLVSAEQLADLTTRVNSAQQLANMGDYDWHIATDVNQWSDQLYRIYGHEPQSFNASYERFLSFIHPDDRERITGVHQQAYASGEPYQMIERIVRPDGEVRYLSSNGQVIQDETGTPVRMRGTCIDITDSVAAERAREHLADRFRGLVESAPDAILVVDSRGRVVQTNTRAARLLGGDVVGHDITELLAWPTPDDHTSATGLDGRDLQLDVMTSAFGQVEDEGLVAVFLRDATPRLANEALAATLREAEARRRQALEINDNVVQGLTAAMYSMDQGDVEGSASYLERTLSAARKIMNDWLAPLGGKELRPGDLMRTAASTLDGAPVPRPDLSPPKREHRRSAGPCRLLIVDDYADIRELLRMQLELSPDFEVVGEAADGLEAVQRATDLQPHVVLLDLAMPRMDGLEALPLIREAVEGVQVIALSGFDSDTMAAKVLAAGAARYVEKGHSMDLAAVIDDVLAGQEL